MNIPLPAPLLNMKLRSKILLGMIGIIIVTGVVMVFFISASVKPKLISKLEKRGISLARNLAVEIINPVMAKQYSELQGKFSDFKASEQEVEYIFLVSPSGAILAHSFDGGFPDGLRKIRNANKGNHYGTQTVAGEKGPVLDITVPVFEGTAGYMHLGFSELSVSRDIQDVIRTLLWIIFASLLCGLGVAIIFANAITRPLSKLSSVVKAVGGGDLSARFNVKKDDEIGMLGKTLNEMIEKRRKAESERDEMIVQLQESIANIKTLSGLLPICASCKKIRDDKGYWNQLEGYIHEHSEAQFSHGICPECAKKLYPEYYDGN